MRVPLIGLLFCALTLTASAQQRSDGYVERHGANAGRAEFLLNTTLAGWQYGLTLPAALGIERERTLATSALLGAGLGFFVPYIVTDRYPVSETEAMATGYGLFTGASHGALLAALLAGPSLGDQALAGAAVAGGAIETALAWRYVARHEIDPGVAQSAIYGNRFGLFNGVLAAAIVAGSTDEDIVYERGVPALVLAGSAGGTLAGYLVGRRSGFTRGDARLWQAAGVTGGLIGLSGAVLLAGEVEDLDGRYPLAILGAGSVGGLLVGERLARGHDFTSGEGHVFSLGVAGGALLGGGIAATADAGVRAAVMLVSIGAVAGLATTYLTSRSEARLVGEMNIDSSLRLMPVRDADGGSAHLVPGLAFRMRL